jgi:hypothetical protein
MTNDEHLEIMNKYVQVKKGPPPKEDEEKTVKDPAL